MCSISLTAAEIAAVESFRGEVLKTNAKLSFDKNKKLDPLSFRAGNVLYLPPRIACNIKFSELKGPAILLSFPNRQDWHAFAREHIYSERAGYKYPACSQSMSYFPEDMGTQRTLKRITVT